MQAKKDKNLEHYAFLLPQGKEWFSPKEVGAIIGRTDQYVRDAFDNQKILGHLLSGRAVKGAEKRRSYQVHRDALLLYIAQTANYDPPDFVAYIKALLKNRSENQLMELMTCIDSLLQRK